MEWYEFLREERARKLNSIEALSSGSLVISARTDGVVRDVSAEMIADHQQHIAELEEILRAAGESFDT